MAKPNGRAITLDVTLCDLDLLPMNMFPVGGDCFYEADAFSGRVSKGSITRAFWKVR